MEYTAYNNLSFVKNTDPRIMKVLSDLVHKNDRIRIWYGDPETGKSWVEENDIIGCVGKSTGITPITLLIKNKRSLGGGGILTAHIVKLVNISKNIILYVHPLFNEPTITVDNNTVYVDNTTHAVCNSNEQAIRLYKFLKGERNCK